MKWDVIEGNWKQYQPQALQQFNKLTDDQLTAVAGKRDKLLAKIQEVYAISKEEAEKHVKAFEESAKEPVAAKVAQPAKASMS